MMARTHLLTGIATASILCFYLHANTIEFLYIQSGTVLGSFLPDIDHPKSAFGSKVKFLSIPISSVFGHRGITHSLLSVLIWINILYLSHKSMILAHKYLEYNVLLGVSLGYVSHILGDYFTNSGVPLFWPNNTRWVSPINFQTGSHEEDLVFFVLLSFVGYLFFKTYPNLYKF